MLKIVDPQEGGPIHAGKLAALTRMNQHLGLRLSSPNGHEQRLRHDVGHLTVLHAPTHHAPGIEVDDHGELGKTLLGPDVGDVGHPNPVRVFNVKLPVESVVDRDRRLAAIIARATFVADLRFDAGQLG